MLGSKNRDYKTEDRKIRARLKYHQKRMDELVKDGLSPDEASKKAFREMTDFESSPWAGVKRED
jgi:hypothetical protein